MWMGCHLNPQVVTVETHPPTVPSNEEMSSTETSIEYAYDVNETPTEAVVAAVVAASDREPLEMTPLSEFINPDALNSIFRSRPYGSPDSGDVRIEFCVGTDHVTVTADHVHVHSFDEE